MSYRATATDFFEKKIKNYSRKYRRIRKDYAEFLDVVEKDPYSGDRIQGCKGPVFKGRMACGDMQKGKSGGFRVMYLVLEQEKEIHLLTLYPKNERKTIDASEINQILLKAFLYQ